MSWVYEEVFVRLVSECCEVSELCEVSEFSEVSEVV